MEKITIIKNIYNVYLIFNICLCSYMLIARNRINEKLRTKMFKFFKYNVVIIFILNILYAYYVSRNDGMILGTIVGALLLLKAHNSLHATELYLKDKEIEFLTTLLRSERNGY